MIRNTLVPAVAGLIAAVVTAIVTGIPSSLGARWPEFPWHHPSWILGITAAAFLAQRFVLERPPSSRNYDGVADLLLHIHAPAQAEPSLRWMIRGSVSFLIALFGGRIGSEGAAIEWVHAALIGWRHRSARWYEQRRRTDAAIALSAGVSAAFFSPMAAVVLSIELGLGGRTLSAVVASIVSFFGASLLFSLLDLPSVRIQDGIEFAAVFSSPRALVSWVFLALFCGVLAAGWIRFYRYSQDSLRDLFQSQAWMRILTGGTLLFLVGIVSPAGVQPPWRLVQELVWLQRTSEQSIVLVLGEALSLALILSGFGTLGIFWALFLLGGLIGAGFGVLTAVSVPAVLIGAAAFFGAVLNAPLSAALLIFEMLNGDLLSRGGLAMAAFVAASLAQFVRKRLGTPSLAESDIGSRGLGLKDGRVSAILDGISVREAMVTDHEVVHEQEPVGELRNRLLKARYPFLPVVGSSGTFTGLLTMDLIQESWRRQEPMAASAPLSKLLEVKDLLYRSGAKPPTVRPQDRLSSISGIFNDLPCVPVIAEDGRIQGLLFAHHVRLAYEREIARRSLAWERPPGLD